MSSGGRHRHSNVLLALPVKVCCVAKVVLQVLGSTDSEPAKMAVTVEVRASCRADDCAVKIHGFAVGRARFADAVDSTFTWLSALVGRDWQFPVGVVFGLCRKVQQRQVDLV